MAFGRRFPCVGGLTNLLRIVLCYHILFVNITEESWESSVKIYKAKSSDSSYPIYVVARNLFDAVCIIQGKKVIFPYASVEKRAHDIIDIHLISDYGATVWVDPEAVK